MWGASFSDLAKKAQEASELASRKAQEASNSISAMQATGDVSQVTSLFNLDSMLEKTPSTDIHVNRICEESQATSLGNIQADDSTCSTGINNDDVMHKDALSGCESDANKMTRKQIYRNDEVTNKRGSHEIEQMQTLSSPEILQSIQDRSSQETEGEVWEFDDDAHVAAEDEDTADKQMRDEGTRPRLQSEEEVKNRKQLLEVERNQLGTQNVNGLSVEEKVSEVRVKDVNSSKAEEVASLDGNEFTELETVEGINTTEDKTEYNAEEKIESFSQERVTEIAENEINLEVQDNDRCKGEATISLKVKEETSQKVENGTQINFEEETGYKIEVKEDFSVEKKPVMLKVEAILEVEDEIKRKEKEMSMLEVEDNNRIMADMASRPEVEGRLLLKVNNKSKLKVNTDIASEQIIEETWRKPGEQATREVEKEVKLKTEDDNHIEEICGTTQIDEHIFQKESIATVQDSHKSIMGMNNSIDTEEVSVEEYRIDYPSMDYHEQKMVISDQSIVGAEQTHTSLDFSSYPVEVQDSSHSDSHQDHGWDKDEIDEMYDDDDEDCDTEDELMAEDPSESYTQSERGFEPPTTFDQQPEYLNGSPNMCNTSGQEEAMSESIIKSIQKVDSEREFSNYEVESDLDEMYESSENDYQTETDLSKEENSMAAIPQFAIDKFMSQLERIHSEHEVELLEMEKKHKIYMDEMKEEVKNASDRAEERTASLSAVANHAKCLTQQRQLEKDFNMQLQQRENMIAELGEKNIELRKQVDELILEADGLNKSLIASKERISEVDEKDREIDALEVNLSSTKEELKTSSEAYSMLKSRVKTVATELKERRVECRTLTLNVQEMSIMRSSLETERNDLQLKSSRLTKNIEEKDSEIEAFVKALRELRLDAKRKEKTMADRGSMGDKALSSYKKKAQASLANANARAAAANQAREDAEIDAANAREEACVALKTAKDATYEKEAATKKADEGLQIFLEEIRELKSELACNNGELSRTKEALKKADLDARSLTKHRDDLYSELESKHAELQNASDRRNKLQQDLAVARIKEKDQESELQILKLDLEERRTAFFMARHNEGKEKSEEIEPNRYNIDKHEKSTESDGTIVMLQQELEVANDAIKELKETLANTIMSKTSKDAADYLRLASSTDDSIPSPISINTKRNSSDSTPLFFAFEKQAELNTARDEITRLAALLGDAESAKTESYDAMDKMRTKMEEAEARLRRNEKLGPANGARLTNSTSLQKLQGNYANRRNIGINALFQNSHESSLSSHSDSTVNLEYLKNIMLRYLNAKSLNEKKALVPVVGAILELTPDELSLALDNIEKSAGINGVGTSLIENMQNKGLVGGLFG
uniref:GRIP domain-containing protein n=1 Tax=Chaetoceros debilis TaxID=122233 RepID=A0A7S3V3W1_9STRA|mmetsp:Transcript_12101/g.18304  ORF Transcript_12101/g.18304 Transcript_12101/m.18304 type:complete len:1350 (+) Transcript_12101:167-4216(+)|eukprot:CAMPEP_0194091238 /NCGR_PEP_ID=MMETSP0149-20130528/42085_1 /TAXON_ID=122233 /ORGANISM="Chaetoceros debilis, Strain MM31A-1" /LENGTH=1349 /DNA_ID=CAMNT_0038775743 /DNA_START=69 /DNA_END=4121 /DNA_ORIENTATION=-